MVELAALAPLRHLRYAVLLLVLSTGTMFLGGCVHYKAKVLDPTRSQDRFQSRSLQDSGMASFAGSFGGTSAWPPKTLNLTTATIIAAYYSPDLAVGRSRLKTAAAAVVTAGGRPNPEASVAGGYETVAGSPVVLRFELSLPIETGGKRRFRILEAQEQLEAARTDFRATAWAVYAKVRDSWFEYVSALRARDLAQREMALRSEVVHLFQQRLTAGEVSTPEVNEMRIAASQSASAYATASGRADAALAQFAMALGVPTNAIKDLPVADEHFTEPPPLSALSLAAVQDRGLLNRLDVRRVQVEYAAADAHLHLELAQQYPDIKLNPGYDFEEGFHKFTFGPAIPLPVWNRNRGPIAEAEARRSEVQARFEATQAKAISDVERTTSLYQAALRRSQEAEQKLGRLQQSQEQQTKRALQLGQEDRLTLLQARLETNSLERERADALAEALTSFAGLEDAVQAPLSKTPIIQVIQTSQDPEGVHP